MADKPRNWSVVRVAHGDPEVIAEKLAEVDDFELSPQANGDVLIVFRTPEASAPALPPAATTQPTDFSPAVTGTVQPSTVAS